MGLLLLCGGVRERVREESVSEPCLPRESFIGKRECREELSTGERLLVPSCAVIFFLELALTRGACCEARVCIVGIWDYDTGIQSDREQECMRELKG